MVKRFFKDSAVYGFGKLLVYGIGFFLIPVYTRAFAPAEFGVVDLLTTVQRLALLTVTLEIAQAVFRFVLDTPDQSERRLYTSTAFWFSTIMYGLFTLVGWALAEPFSRLLLRADGLADVFRAALVMIWTAGTFNMFQNQLRVQLKSRLYTVVSVVDAAVSMGLTILLIIIFRTGVMGVVVGQTVGLLLGAVIAWWFTREDFALLFDRRKLAEMLRFSLPLVPSSIGIFVYLYVDRLTINALMTTADVGLFGVGYRIAAIVSLLMFGFQLALTPVVFSQHRDPNTPPALARIFRLFVALALLLVIALSLFSREILLLLTTPDYAAAWSVVPLLVPATVLSSMYVFAPGLSIAKKTGIIAAINLAGAVLNTILNLSLIPPLGIEGAALATLLSTAAVFAAYMVFSQREYPAPHRWLPLLAGVVMTIAVVALGGQIGAPSLPAVALKLILLVGVGVLFLPADLLLADDLRRGWSLVSNLRLSRLGSQKWQDTDVADQESTP